MKTIKIENVNYVRTGYDREDITRQEFVSVIFSLDDNGKVIKEEHFNQDNNLEDYIENEYDGESLLVSSQYNSDGELLMRTNNTYDADKHLVKRVNLYGEEGVDETVIFEYSNNLLCKELLDDEGNRLLLKEYFYESPVSAELLSKRVEYDEDGVVQYIYMYEYDDKKQVVEMKVEEVAAKDRRVFDYVYDEQGNKIKELIYNYDDALIAKKYFEYLPDGKILSEEAEDLDNYKKTVYEYDGENLTKISVFAKDESLQSWSELLYDDDNRLVASADYIIDEVDPSEYRLLAEAHRIYE